MKFLIVLAVLLIGLLYWYFKKRKPNVVTTTTTTKSVDPLPTTTTVDEPTTTTSPSEYNNAIIFRYDDISVNVETMCGLLPYQFTNTFFSTPVYTFYGFEPHTTIDLNQIYIDQARNVKLSSWEHFVSGYRWGVLYGSDPISHTFYMDYNSVNSWVDCSTVTTTVPPTTEAPTTTLKPVEVFYSLHRCDTMENTYETGPLAEGTYSSGDRVEGATGIYYVVNGSQNASFGHTNIMVTGTGEISCP